VNFSDFIGQLKILHSHVIYKYLYCALFLCIILEVIYTLDGKPGNNNYSSMSYQKLGIGDLIVVVV